MLFRIIAEQKRIYHSTHRKNLLNAGPNTGKSTVLACYGVRLANLLFEKQLPGASPLSKVLYLATSNDQIDRAQAQFKDLIQDSNVQKEIGPFRYPSRVLNNIRLFNFHSFALKVLQENQKNKQGSTSFNIDNEADEKILNTLLTKSSFKKKNDSQFRRRLLEIVSQYYSGTKPLTTILRKYYPAHDSFAKDILSLIKDLDKEKKKSNQMTFNDVLHQLYELLLNDRKIRIQFRKRYPVILVDDFQNIMDLQWKIIKAMAGRKTYLMATGDDGQNTMHWAGASFYRFTHFNNVFIDDDYLEFDQTVMQRGTKQIADFCNQLTAQSRFATTRSLKSNGSGPKSQIVCDHNLSVLYQFVADTIHNFLNAGKSLNDIGIVFSRFSMIPYLLMDHLIRSNIPCKTIGDKSKRDREFPLIVFALIRIIDSSVLDKGSLRLVLQCYDNIGEKKAEKIIPYFKTRNSRQDLLSKDYVYIESLKKLHRFIREMKKSSVPNIDKLWAIIGFVKMLPKVSQSIPDHTLPSLFKLAHQSKSLTDIIEKYNDYAQPLYYPCDEKPPYPDEYVTISDIHRVRQYEFDTVFYFGTDGNLLSKNYSSNMKGYERELHSINVALGRAQRKLYLLFPIDRKVWDSGSKKNPWHFVRKINRKYYKLIKP